ncbi:short chain dehydrogenase [Enemella dayhoffiae]|uniref:Short chain dehydrogenase n=1 Tax=Enemella dayhoffiae TaxID=2016507 RepID=A0A255GL92_9ACTN|nr:SDR family oxidoreductase [Enemella dayhoffiae]OYO16580.1 short chain dehydrogenase [Enemella dayhoffiae]
MNRDPRGVIVTGGTRGIGAAIAARFAAAGDRVLVCGRTPPPALPDGVECTSCDVRDPEQVQELIEQAIQRLGRLDVVVNNAGGAPVVDAATVSPRLVSKVIELNLIAPFLVAQAGYRVMREQDGGGVVLNIGSVAGNHPARGTAAYTAAKAGLSGLTRALALEFAPEVRVNQVTVGLVLTELAEQYYGDEQRQAEVAAVVPMNRMATPEDVAAACLLLAAADAGYVNGAELLVDGGGEFPARDVVLRR